MGWLPLWACDNHRRLVLGAPLNRKLASVSQKLAPLSVVQFVQHVAAVKQSEAARASPLPRGEGESNTK
jgi:hypothetical protein